MFYAILIVIILNPILGLLQWKLYSPIILQKSVCFIFCRLTSFCTPQITERSMAFHPCEYLWGVVGWALHLAGHWSLCGVDLGQDVGLSATGVRAPLVLKSCTRKQEDPGQEVMALLQFEMVYYWSLYAFKNLFISSRPSFSIVKCTGISIPCLRKYKKITSSLPLCWAAVGSNDLEHSHAFFSPQELRMYAELKRFLCLYSSSLGLAPFRM